MTEEALIFIQEVNIKCFVYTEHVLIKIQPKQDKELISQTQQK